MKLIAQIVQPVQPIQKPSLDLFDAVHPFLTPALIVACTGLMYTVMRNQKKDILEEIGEKITKEIGNLDTKLTGEIGGLAEKVDRNSEEISRIVVDIKGMKTEISGILETQKNIVTAVRVIARIGDENPEVVRKTVEEVLP